jgi:membrane-associated phospholipid phosphatase
VCSRSIRTILTCTLAVAVSLGVASLADANEDPQPGPQPEVAPEPEGPPTQAPGEEEGQRSDRGVLADIRAYFTAPLRWDLRDWAWFGGAVVLVGGARHFDSQVRSHFVGNLAPAQSIKSDDVQDALPTVAVVAATGTYAWLADDHDGRQEAWTMFEAGTLSTVTTYALKYAIAREGPDQTSSPNQWFKGGGRSFPSEHASAAFAVGTVLAESGNDEYRWLRRLLGYGLGVATSYERLRHNAHWLSDTVAGAALGAATANFAMKRNYRSVAETSWSVTPVQGGMMLTYRVELP